MELVYKYFFPEPNSYGVYDYTNDCFLHCVAIRCA